MSLFEEKKQDNFNSESPIRAFTDFQVSGTVAIGKGFRPSIAHLATYLDAMERKEGWRFVQLLVSQTGGDPTILFHREAGNATMPEMAKREITFNDVDEFLRRQGFALVEDGGDLKLYKPENALSNDERMDAAFSGRKFWGLPEPEGDKFSLMQKREDTFHHSTAKVSLAKYHDQHDLGAPHGVHVLILVRSNFGKSHECSGFYRDGRWHVVTQMDGAASDEWRTEPLEHNPVAWRLGPPDKWTRQSDIYAELAKDVMSVDEAERVIGKHPNLAAPFGTGSDGIKFDQTPEIIVRAAPAPMIPYEQPSTELTRDTEEALGLHKQDDLGVPHHTAVQVTYRTGANHRAHYADGAWWYGSPGPGERYARVPMKHTPLAWRHKLGDEWTPKREDDNVVTTGLA
jgi:hypothetical protein